MYTSNKSQIQQKIETALRLSPTAHFGKHCIKVPEVINHLRFFLLKKQTKNPQTSSISAFYLFTNLLF